MSAPTECPDGRMLSPPGEECPDEPPGDGTTWEMKHLEMNQAGR